MEANYVRLGSTTEAPGLPKGLSLWTGRPGALLKQIMVILALLWRLLVGHMPSNCWLSVGCTTEANCGYLGSATEAPGRPYAFQLLPGRPSLFRMDLGSLL